MLEELWRFHSGLVLCLAKMGRAVVPEIAIPHNFLFRLSVCHIHGFPRSMTQHWALSTSKRLLPSAESFISPLGSRGSTHAADSLCIFKRAKGWAWWQTAAAWLNSDCSDGLCGWDAGRSWITYCCSLEILILVLPEADVDYKWPQITVESYLADLL